MADELNENELDSINGGLPRIPTKGMGLVFSEPQKPTPYLLMKIQKSVCILAL